MNKDSIQRCSWATTELYKKYHDEEWGKPLHSEQILFEMLLLECMQAGLSWITILNKRESFRKAFDNFDYRKIALYDDKKQEELMQNELIIRNKVKIKAAIINAQKFIEVQEKYGSFDKFIWSYTQNKVIYNHFDNESQMPATSLLSDKISKDLKKLGFKFIGSTSVYAYIQSIGIVNDHVKKCFLYKD
ncbi:DNA-3-methyladenine glycosylase [Metamycoplasma hyosynoviae]|uniref:DNA-3-methyladenine glycosylase I n=2 Tax=Metamycoplasma hyosynoviae TaxID=29559 RepID=UPI000461831E|nr:DNA-3-methyladenine glycosylase I [Metamycoplasma hyosynoviae]KDE42741.1 DNA-3-methyladenine glycosylase [Metamycoplasma hyosynoviae]MDC8920554.1 DNA-3-methyladenine glycosylase I [Metamycoplasma hyosynoviae]MDD7848274.1 DNA-3-methyladenine glycosylase I [Metamycoplasma hyosynoviae]MDI3064077.1 DNA-3-methyladenine glycosylase I [Metamycoplasma hyosynoviae]